MGEDDVVEVVEEEVLLYDVEGWEGTIDSL